MRRRQTCDECPPVHMLSGLNGRDALVDFCQLPFDDKIIRNAKCIAHTSSQYDTHFIVSYLVKNTEYTSLLSKGGKIFEMHIEMCNAKVIDSWCFLSIPLSKVSDTFNLPYVRDTFLHLFNTSDHYDYVGTLPPLHYYDPDGMKEPARTQMIEWHREIMRATRSILPKQFTTTARRADVQLLKSGCMQFRNGFFADTGIYPFQSCVFRTSHLKPQTIGRVPVNSYRQLQKYCMAWITYCEKFTGSSYRYTWSCRGEKYIKNAKAWADF